MQATVGRNKYKLYLCTPEEASYQIEMDKKQPEEPLEQAGWGGGERGMTVGRKGRHSATTFLFFL